MTSAKNRPRQQKAAVNSVSVSAVIRTARGKRTQGEFADFLGIKQPALSKYESGEIPNPSAQVIETCLGILEEQRQQKQITVAELQRRVRDVLSGPERASARKAMSDLLDCIESNRG